MMRVDPQDREDIGFLLGHTRIDEQRLDSLVNRASVPEIPEIREAFEQNLLWLKKTLS